jgi:hypothetical protein
MGLRLVCDIAPAGFRCSIKEYRLDDSCGKPVVAADGATLEEAREHLVRLISGRIIRSTVRETYLLWVPSNLAP